MAAISTAIAAASVAATLYSGQQAKKAAEKRAAEARKAQEANAKRAREELAQAKSQSDAAMAQQQAAADKSLAQQKAIADRERAQQQKTAITQKERRLLDSTATDTDTRVSLGTNKASDELLKRGRKKTGGSKASAKEYKSTATKVGGL